MRRERAARKSVFWGLGAAAAMAAAVLSVSAQDGEAPAGPPVKAYPAEIAPLASKSLLLDITAVGGRWFAVGDRGNIVVSANGSDWTQVPTPVRSALAAVSFADAQNGWAVGHDAAILGTRDGGKTWTLQHFKAELEKPLLDVIATGPTSALAIGAYGLMMQTSDGQTWAELDAPAVREGETHLNGITALADGALLIAGESGLLALSADQGKTWSKLTAPYDNSLFGAVPFGAAGAVLYGLRGNVYLSEDVRKGDWKKLETESVASMFGGAVLADGSRALVGLNGVVVLIAADGSARLSKSERGTPLSSVVADSGSLLAVGESGVQRLNLK